MRNNNLYIQPNFYSFLEELAANNTRNWFKSHKNDFETQVFLPFKALTETVIFLMQKIDPEINIAFNQAAFRIYRDIRFSPDKTPYKLWMGAVVSRNGRKNTTMPEVYFQFGPGENFIAAGLYKPDKNTLYRIRQKIAENPVLFEQITNAESLINFFPDGIQGERNKRLPVKTWQQTAQKYPFILNKQFYAVNFYSRKKILQTANLAEFIVSHYKAMESFNNWLMTSHT